MGMSAEMHARNAGRSRAEVWLFYEKDHKEWFAYLSSEGRIVTWMGDALATVVSETVRDMSGFVRHQRTYVRVVDGKGRHWYGQGPGRGMYVRLRRAKSCMTGEVRR